MSETNCTITSNKKNLVEQRCVTTVIARDVTDLSHISPAVCTLRTAVYCAPHHITSASDQPIINPDISRNKMAATSDARHVLAECQPRGRRHRVPRPPKDNASGIRRSGFLRLVNRAICNDYTRAFYQPRLRHNVAIDSLPAPMIVDG